MRAARGSSALRCLWNHGVVARVVDPKPWYRSRRDEQLERLEAILADAVNDKERSEVEGRGPEAVSARGSPPPYSLVGRPTSFRPPSLRPRVSRHSWTIRTARSRSSGGYLLGDPMCSILSPRDGASTEPGALHLGGVHHVVLVSLDVDEGPATASTSCTPTSGCPWVNNHVVVTPNA